MSRGPAVGAVQRTMQGTTQGTDQVALLRGVNVGKAKRIAMADLRALVEGLGYTDVRTLLNSGNVVYRAPRVSPGVAAAAIQQAMEESLGLRARVFALDAGAFDAVIAENPLLDVMTDPARLLVTVLDPAAPRAKLEALAARDWGAEHIAVGSRACYTWCPDGISRSQLPVAMQPALGDGGTARNWATMLKLQAMLAG